MKKKQTPTKTKTATKPAAKAPPIANIEFFQKKLEEMRDDLLRTVQKKKE